MGLTLRGRYLLAFGGATTLFCLVYVGQFERGVLPLPEVSIDSDAVRRFIEVFRSESQLKLLLIDPPSLTAMLSESEWQQLNKYKTFKPFSAIRFVMSNSNSNSKPKLNSNLNSNTNSNPNSNINSNSNSNINSNLNSNSNSSSNSNLNSNSTSNSTSAVLSVTTLGVIVSTKSLPEIRQLNAALSSRENTAFRIQIAELIGVSGFNRHWNDTENPQKRNLVPFQYFYLISELGPSLGPELGPRDGPSLGPSFGSQPLQKVVSLVQLVLFYRRHDYFWVGQVERDELGVKLSDLNLAPSDVDALFESLQFGLTEMAFDLDPKAVLSRGQENHVTVLHLPHRDPVAFLSQVATSRFLECNFAVAGRYHALYGRKFPENGHFNALVKDQIQVMKNFAEDQRMEIWIGCGITLGWWRQCGVIPYTADVDFETYASYATYELEAALQDAGFNIHGARGFPWEAFELSIYRRRQNVDLFFNYELDNGTWGITSHVGKGYYYVSRPRFDICSGELLGVKVLVPCTPEAVLEADYGPGWTEPNNHWSWIDSPPNRGAYRAWTADELPYVYRNWLKREFRKRFKATA